MDFVAKLRQRGKKRSTPETPVRHKNGFKTSLPIFILFIFYFFLENAKNLGWLDDAKRRKKGGWPKSVSKKMHNLSFRLLQNDVNSTEIQPNALYLIV